MKKLSGGKINPKRLQKIIQKKTELKGVGTKAQEALKLQHQENNLEKKINNKRKKEEDKERKFNIKQMKRKKKHKGR